MIINNIEYKPIPNFHGYSASINGDIYSHKKSRNLKGAITKTGYRQYSLRVSGKQNAHSVFGHVLVAEAWLDRKRDQQVHHIDGNKLNNRVENLEIVSHKEHVERTKTLCQLDNMGIKNAIKQGHAIVQIDKNGFVVGVYSSKLFAKMQTMIPITSIKNALIGTNKFAYGYSFEYLDRYKGEILPEKLTFPQGHKGGQQNG